MTIEIEQDSPVKMDGAEDAEIISAGFAGESFSTMETVYPKIAESVFPAVRNPYTLRYMITDLLSNTKRKWHKD